MIPSRNCTIRRRHSEERSSAAGVDGAAADLGASYGDISWELNAMMPGRKLYLFDTFSGYDRRDTDVEKEKGLSEAQPGDYAPTEYGRNISETAFSPAFPIRKRST